MEIREILSQLMYCSEVIDNKAEIAIDKAEHSIRKSIASELEKKLDRIHNNEADCFDNGYYTAKYEAIKTVERRGERRWPVKNAERNIRKMN